MAMQMSDPGDAGTGRRYALLGDADLDEGAIWEAVHDPVIVGAGLDLL
jgi:pyruvate dehydrogenase E1 component